MSDNNYEVRYSNVDDTRSIVKVLMDFSEIDIYDVNRMVKAGKPITNLSEEQAIELRDKLNECGVEATIYPDVSGYKISITSYDKNSKDELTFCLIDRFNVNPKDIPSIFSDLDNGKDYVLLEKVRNLSEANYLEDIAVKAGATIKSERVEK